MRSPEGATERLSLQHLLSPLPGLVFCLPASRGKLGTTLCGPCRGLSPHFFTPSEGAGGRKSPRQITHSLTVAALYVIFQGGCRSKAKTST